MWKHLRMGLVVQSRSRVRGGWGPSHSLCAVYSGISDSSFRACAVLSRSSGNHTLHFGVRACSWIYGNNADNAFGLYYK